MKIERYAGIDIGSNGVRLLIMNLYIINNQPRFDKTILVRAPIRLGSDSFVKNEIQEDTLEMLTEAMKSFNSLMKCYKVKKYRACATSALREASNAEDVVKKVFQNSEIQIELIDGKEEAEIIYTTQIIDYIKDEKGYLFIDVGGGSTELTYYYKGKSRASRSFKIGTVRALKNLVEYKEWIEMENFIKELKLAEDTVAVGTGGNINTLFKKSQKPLGKPLTIRYLKDMYKELKMLTVDERIIQYNYNPDRADVIVPALEIYTTIMKSAKINDIYVPKIGLADGIVRSLYQE
ncbi:MAG: exopolyphosphatase [Chitinophagales bacterium]|nr:exopolyphosphatase [Chitinophagales bacterium]